MIFDDECNGLTVDSRVLFTYSPRFAHASLSLASFYLFRAVRLILCCVFLVLDPGTTATDVDNTRELEQRAWANACACNVAIMGKQLIDLPTIVR